MKMAESPGEKVRRDLDELSDLCMKSNLEQNRQNEGKKGQKEESKSTTLL